MKFMCCSRKLKKQSPQTHMFVTSESVKRKRERLSNSVFFSFLLQAIYSRVARVCKNDRGGLHKFAHKWTTFLKARLNCSVPGDFPFYFNEIQGTTNFVQDGSKDKIIYATFTTPDNSLAGSAICSFKLSDIRKAFDEGQFKGQVSRYLLNSINSYTLYIVSHMNKLDFKELLYS